MATEVKTTQNVCGDALTIIRQGVEKLKANKAHMGIGHYKTLRMTRKELNELIKEIEGNGEEK